VKYEMKLNRKNPLVAYIDNIVILKDTEDYEKVIDELIKSSHKINLTINKTKTKYLVLT
jgi:hypothetical protein